MPDYKQLSLSQILIGNRQRPIDRDYAAVIGASMKEHGQLQPIVVRAHTAAERPYTLVIGGHRCTGAEIHEIEMLDAIVVKANSADAQMLELAENLHRRDLSVLDRAYFVQAYRDLWESKYGKISAGRDNSAKFALLSTDGTLATLKRLPTSSGFLNVLPNTSDGLAVSFTLISAPPFRAHRPPTTSRSCWRSPSWNH